MTSTNANGTKTKQVALVGAGGIGSRLIQSIVRLAAEHPNTMFELTAVDPSEASLSVAEQRAGEAGGPLNNLSVSFSTSPEALPKTTDLLIISTPSGPRLKALEGALKHTTAKKIFLEKFLFPKIADYAVATELLGDTPCVVHTPRTAWPGYLDLINRNPSSSLVMRAGASSWALSSNAIHFFSVFERLAGAPIVNISGEALDDKPIENKRAGYLDVTGTLRVTAENGARLDLYSLRTGSLPLHVDLAMPTARYSINELGQKMTSSEEKNNWEWTPEPFKILRASEMEHELAAFMNTGTCNLPTYADMIQPHIESIKVFNHVFFGEGHDEKACPIT